MPRDPTLLSLLSAIPVRSRDELLSFLAFSERDQGPDQTHAADELLVSLSFFNAHSLRPN